MTTTKERWARIALLFILTIPFSLLIFPMRRKALTALTEDGQNPTLDVRLSYTPQAALDTAEKLGAEGRRLYSVSELTLDVAFPLLYSALLSNILGLLYRSHPNPSTRQNLSRIPFALLLADLMENCSIASLMLVYPDPRFSNLAARFAAFFTSLKWFIGLFVLCTILWLVVMNVWIRFRKDRVSTL